MNEQEQSVPHSSRCDSLDPFYGLSCNCYVRLREINKHALAYPIGGGKPVPWEVAEREQDAIEMAQIRLMEEGS